MCPQFRWSSLKVHIDLPVVGRRWMPVVPSTSAGWCCPHAPHSTSRGCFSSLVLTGQTQHDLTLGIAPLGAGGGQEDGQRSLPTSTSDCMIPWRNLRRHGLAKHRGCAFSGKAWSTDPFLLKFRSVFNWELSTAEAKHLKAVAVGSAEAWASPPLCGQLALIYSWSCSKGGCGDTFIKTTTKKWLWKPACDSKRGFICHENQ